MTNSRSKASRSKLLAILLLVLWAGIAEAGGRKRVVVLELEGPKSDKFHEDLEKLIRKSHTVVPTEKWNSTAENLDASSLTDKDVKKVAKKLHVDAIVTGRIEKRRDEYILRLRVREGKTGEQVGSMIDTKADGPRIDSKAQKDLNDELIDQIANIESNRGGASADDEDADKPTAKKGGKKPAADDDEDADKPVARDTKKGKKPAADDDDDTDKPVAKKGFSKKSDDERGGEKVDGKKEESAEDDDGSDKPVAKKDDKKGFSKKTLTDDDDGDKPVAKKDDKKKKVVEPAVAKKSKTEDDPPPKADKADKADKKVVDDEDSDERASKKKKAAKKVASSDDEDGVEKDTGDEDAAATGDAALAPNERALDAVVGLSVTARRLSFNTRADLANKPPGYKGTPVAGAMLDVTFYPLAMGHTRTDILKNVGLYVMYDRVLKIDTKDAMGTHYATTEQRYGFGAAFRYAFNKSPSSPVVGGTLGYASQAFTIAANGMMVPDIPSVSYTILEPGGFFRLPVNPKIVLNADAKFMLITDTGPIQSAMQYGAATVLGFEGSVGGDYSLTKNIFVRATFRIETIGLSFQGKGNQTTMRDGDATSIDVGGARDTYYGGTATVGYLY